MDASTNKVNYRDLIPRKNGFVFKFIKVGEHFIHTYTEGDFHDRIGISPSAIIGKTLFEFLPEEQAKQKQHFYEIAWSGKTVNYEGSVNDCFYIASLSPLIVDSKVVEVNGTAIDITEEKKNERKIQDMDKLSVIGQLAAGIAHEIRNPLTSIKGFAQIIQERVDQPDVKTYLIIMLDELERMNQIVTEFMVLAKPHEIIDIKKVDVNKLIRSVIQFMEPQSLLKKIRILTSFECSITAFLDEIQLKQVLINLLQNAMEASESTKNCIEIKLKSIDDQHYLIQVKDQGPGMPLEKQNRLFEPFYTTKENGTGLGLLICKQIIDAHKGSIDIISRHGEGTVVNILLPKVFS
ncbi:ATP-binding protein [Heyndrickxia acidicola]|uniref:histidine kinase n=1 Tax=Heyndrickxia acidicola TaxID=209389 RepID=A0ABU6MG91_9BACI|nr:ATP-binding protein [Heyndrickxia acidicola]MED1203704.1 ATP-binding protein [Heyndrickxia acidicola]